MLSTYMTSKKDLGEVKHELGEMRREMRKLDGRIREAELRLEAKIAETKAEIIAKVNDLFVGDLSDGDRLVYVNDVIKGKLLESGALAVQAANNSKAQFAASPTLDEEIMDAIMDALEAHQTMSRQALDSSKVRAGLKSILLGPARLYEALRGEADGWRPKPFAEHGLVRTRRLVRGQGVDVPSGSVGVVVDVYGQGDAYEVEFQERPGLVLTLRPDALEAADA